MKLVEMKPFDGIKLTMMNDTRDSTKENANAIVTPRNVILLLIDERGQDEKKEENSWKDYKENLHFAIEGFLQVLLHNHINRFYVRKFEKKWIDRSTFFH